MSGGHHLFGLDSVALRATSDADRSSKPFASPNPRMRVRDILEEALQALRDPRSPPRRAPAHSRCSRR